MIDRLIHIFAQNGAEEVVVIINNEVPLTKAHLHELEKNSEVPLRVVVKTTPSSMHSFYELSRYLKDDRFCLTTVDTISGKKSLPVSLRPLRLTMATA